jgi:hypothetical protein
MQTNEVEFWNEPSQRMDRFRLTCARWNIANFKQKTKDLLSNVRICKGSAKKIIKTIESRQFLKSNTQFSSWKSYFHDSPFCAEPIFKLIQTFTSDNINIFIFTTFYFEPRSELSNLWYWERPWFIRRVDTD